MEFVIGEFPHVARFPLPDAGDRVAGLGVGRGVPVENVVGGVETGTGEPLGELRARGVVADRVVPFVELDPEVVDEFVPEPVDAGPWLTRDVRGGSLDQRLVVVDVVRPHELVDVGRFDELPGGSMNHPVRPRFAFRSHAPNWHTER